MVHLRYLYDSIMVVSQMYTRKDVERAVDALAGPHGAGYASLLSARDYPLEDVGLAFEEATMPQAGVKVLLAIGDPHEGRPAGM